MSDTKFKPGDLVQLKSGGPIMTVHSVDTKDGTEAVWCTFFKSGDEMTQVMLHAAELNCIPERNSIV